MFIVLAVLAILSASLLLVVNRTYAVSELLIRYIKGRLDALPSRQLLSVAGSSPQPSHQIDRQPGGTTTYHVAECIVPTSDHCGQRRMHALRYMHPHAPPMHTSSGFQVRNVTIGPEDLAMLHGPAELLRLEVQSLTWKWPTWRAPARITMYGLACKLQQRRMPEVGSVGESLHKFHTLIDPPVYVCTFHRPPPHPPRHAANPCHGTRRRGGS